MSEIVRIDDFGPCGFKWLTLKRITVSRAGMPSRVVVELTLLERLAACSVKSLISVAQSPHYSLCACTATV